MKKLISLCTAATLLTASLVTPVLADELETKEYTIGICNYVDDASLNQIVENIEQGLAEIGAEKGVKFNINYDNCNADNAVLDQIITQFRADSVDLMVGVATPVAMAMQAATEDDQIPVIFSAVSDPVGAGIGEQVLTVTGSTARKMLGGDHIPVDAAIVAIIDTLEVEREKAEGKPE